MKSAVEVNMCLTCGSIYNEDGMYCNSGNCYDSIRLDVVIQLENIDKVLTRLRRHDGCRPVLTATVEKLEWLSPFPNWKGGNND